VNTLYLQLVVSNAQFKHGVIVHESTRHCFILCHMCIYFCSFRWADLPHSFWDTSNMIHKNCLHFFWMVCMKILIELKRSHI